MKAIITRMNRTLFELETGILIFGIFCQIPISFLKDRVSCSAGLWTGIAAAVFAAFHMWLTLDRGLSMGDKAAGYLSGQNMIRYFVIVAVIILTAVTGIGNPLTAFLGVMGLKVSAYMNFLTKKISRLLYGEEIFPELTEEPAKEQE